MTGSYSEILERPLLKQGIAEDDEEEDQDTEDEGKEEVSELSQEYMSFNLVKIYLSICQNLSIPLVFL